MDELTVPGFSGRPAIAVLPFENLSGDPDQEHFADGIAEDLITRLSSWRWFPVIARNSSFVYKGKAVGVKQVSRELGVRYVVEGSVRKAADRVRISAQLIDATSGHHVWATRCDRELREIFALQDEITEAIVASMDPELRRFEMERVARQDPRNFEAWELVERGLWHFYQFNKDDNAKARVLFERACEQDSHLALAFSALAWTHASDLIHQWTDSSTRSIAELHRSARRGVALDDKEPLAHLALAWASSFAGQEDQALAASELAVQLNPSFAEGYAWRGMFLARAGRSDDAIASIERAMRLSPQDPLTWFFLHMMALAQFAAGRYEEAVEWAQRSLQRKPDSPLACRVLAASYAQLGRVEEARRASDEVSRLTPEFSLSAIRLTFASADPSLRERLVEALRKAGVKE
jgi:adenylate cyclase